MNGSSLAGASPYMAMPVRTMSKWARGPRSVAALFAVWQMRPGYCSLSSPASSVNRAQLLLEEAGVRLVGGGEVAHEAGEHAAGVRLLAELADLVRRHAEPAHARVELDVHADAEADGLGDERRRPGDDLGAGRRGPLEPGAGERAEDEDRRA